MKTHKIPAQFPVRKSCVSIRGMQCACVASLQRCARISDPVKQTHAAAQDKMFSGFALIACLANSFIMSGKPAGTVICGALCKGCPARIDRMPAPLRRLPNAAHYLFGFVEHFGICIHKIRLTSKKVVDKCGSLRRTAGCITAAHQHLDVDRLFH